MQATVSAFDTATRNGAVLLDDGIQLLFGADALQNSGLRLLRPGQRVRLTTRGEGSSLRIEELQLITLA